jgi:hypothetical protein
MPDFTELEQNMNMDLLDRPWGFQLGGEILLVHLCQTQLTR